MCVEQAIRLESSQEKASKESAIHKARAKVEELKAASPSNPQAILKAEAELAALEAEKVTGLKPVKMSGRGGRNGRSSTGRGVGGRGSGRSLNRR
jgi:hypothetical protein